MFYTQNQLLSAFLLLLFSVQKGNAVQTLDVKLTWNNVVVESETKNIELDTTDEEDISFPADAESNGDALNSPAQGDSKDEEGFILGNEDNTLFYGNDEKVENKVIISVIDEDKDEDEDEEAAFQDTDEAGK